MKLEKESGVILVEENVLTTNVVYSNFFTHHDKAEATRNAYLSDWEDFCMWCQKRNCSYLPADPCKVADYLEDRAKNTWKGISGKNRLIKEKAPLKWNTLMRRLTAISKTHHYTGYEFNRKHPAIEKTLKGVKRILSKYCFERIVETRKDPLLIEDIRKMIEALPDNIRGVRDRALLLTGFVGALRRSEICQICLEHLKFTKEGLELFIPWSKTGARYVYLPYGSNPITCPVRSLREWVEQANITQGPLFRAINRHGKIQARALSDKAVVLIIQKNFYIKDKINRAKEKKLYDFTEVLPNYGGHSLRAGFVTTAILKEVPEHSIMHQTGHKKSDTIKKYIRLTDKWKNNAATKIGL